MPNYLDVTGQESHSARSKTFFKKWSREDVKRLFLEQLHRRTTTALWVRGLIATDRLILPTWNYFQPIILFAKMTIAFSKGYDVLM